MFKEEGEGGGGKKMCVYRAYGLSPRLKIYIEGKKIYGIVQSYWPHFFHIIGTKKQSVLIREKSG